MMPNGTQVATEFGRLVRFGVTGTVAALAYAELTFVLVETGLARPVAATIFGYFVAATISYLGHMYFSFRVEPDHRTFFWRFVAMAAIIFAMTILVTYLVTDILGGSYRISIAAVTVLIPTTNYICNRFWVFQPGVKVGRDTIHSHSGIARRPIKQCVFGKSCGCFWQLQSAGSMHVSTLSRRYSWSRRP